MKDRIDDLVDLSRRFSKLTFTQKLELLEEAAELLRKGRPMKAVLEEAGRGKR